MDALRSGLVQVTDQILVDRLCHKWDHRSCYLTYGNQSGIQSHISVDLILLHTLRPETLTASSDIPVAHVIYKILQGSCSLWDPVVRQVIVYLFDQGV